MFLITFSDTQNSNLAKMARQIADHQGWSSLVEVSTTDGNPGAMQDIDKFPFTTLYFENEAERQSAGRVLGEQFQIVQRSQQ